MDSSHGADLELARLCAMGDEHAWERFIREYRPLLYRAAGKSSYRDLLRSSADAVWSLARSPTEGLFAVSWTGPPGPG